jgi:hypothetical protein
MTALLADPGSDTEAPGPDTRRMASTAACTPLATDEPSCKQPGRPRLIGS